MYNAQLLHILPNDDHKSSESACLRGDFVKGIGINQEQTMRSRSTLTLAALVLGAACASVPAFAQSRQSNLNYSNTGPYSGAPLSPGGISAAPSAFGGPGPGYIGPAGGKGTPAPYSNTVASGAPLSPGGIATGGQSFGGPGPGYIGPSTHATPAAYPNSRPSGAPLSPGGIATGASSFGGPGYMGN
jgi:hypothetical protein